VQNFIVQNSTACTPSAPGLNTITILTRGTLAGLPRPFALSNLGSRFRGGMAVSLSGCPKRRRRALTMLFLFAPPRITVLMSTNC
jgi:hypothetical protein